MVLCLEITIIQGSQCLLLNRSTDEALWEVATGARMPSPDCSELPGAPE